MHEAHAGEALALGFQDGVAAVSCCLDHWFLLNATATAAAATKLCPWCQDPRCGNTVPGSDPAVPFTCDSATSEYDPTMADTRPPSQQACCKVRTAQHLLACAIDTVIVGSRGLCHYVIHAASGPQPLPDGEHIIRFGVCAASTYSCHGVTCTWNHSALHT